MSATNINPADKDDISEAAITTLLAKSTLPVNVDFSVDGRFDSEEEAKGLLEAGLAFFKLFGAFLNLEGLEAVVITDDYKGAISRIERGFGNAPALTPTEDGFGSGAAMAVPVLREGRLKTHIVLHSNLLRVLESNHEGARGIVIHTMAHEAAHADDLEVESRNLPGAYGSYIPDYKEGRLFLLAHKCWGEYIASHLSSRWGTDDYCKGYSDMLCSMLSSARERGDSALDRYGSHREVSFRQGCMIQAGRGW